MNYDIQRELAIVDRDNPGYLRRFQDLIQQGQVDGRYYGGSNTQGCGCFYGWLADLEVSVAERMVKKYTYELLGTAYAFTPIETLLTEVRPLDTPDGITEGSEALQELNQEIEEYFQQKGTVQ